MAQSERCLQQDGDGRGKLHLHRDCTRQRAVYLSEEVLDYVVDNAAGDVIEIDGFTINQLRVSLGAELTRAFTLENGMLFTPSVGPAASRGSTVRERSARSKRASRCNRVLTGMSTPACSSTSKATASILSAAR